MNTPEYFDPKEEQDLLDYLLHELEDYFVYEEKGEIVGCGGINYFKEKNIARISWDFIHPHYHGQGIGRRLVQYRINQLKDNPDINKVIVRTSQKAYEFYKKMGFRTNKTQLDYWAPGLHMVEMFLDI